MARHERFTFLVNKNERAQIVELAERLRRSQSDAVRFVVLEAARGLQGQHAERNAATPNADALGVRDAIAR